MFSALQKQTNIKPLSIQNGLRSKYHQNISIKTTSFANSPPTKFRIVHNGARIGKLEKEVLPPQWAVGGRSSLS